MSDQRTFTERNPNKIAAGGLAGGIVLAVAILGSDEGMRTHAYLDIGNVWTVCEGITEGVKKGDVYTIPQCINLRNRDVQKRVAAMQKCLHAPVSPMTASAMIRFSYNVGVQPYCKRVAANFNAGKQILGCTWMLQYHYVGKRSVPGLVKRRGRESHDCIAGLT